MDEKDRRTRIRSSIRDYYAIQTSPERELRATPAATAKKDGAPGSPGGQLNMDSEEFSVGAYTTKILKEKSLQGVYEEDTRLRKKARELDGELQSLVYDNYSKFIAATDTIRKMKTNVTDMDARLQALSANVERIDDVSKDIRGRLEEQRSKIEEVMSVNTMLRKIRFLVALPATLQKYHDNGQYATAVKYWVAGDSILEKYKDVASFSQTHSECRAIAQKCHDALLKRIRTTDLEADKVDPMKADIEALRQVRLTTINPAANKVKDSVFNDEVLAILLQHAKESFSSKVGRCFVDVETKETEFSDKLKEMLTNTTQKPSEKINLIVEHQKKDHSFALTTLKDAFLGYRAYCIRAREVLCVALPSTLEGQLMEEILPVLSQALSLMSNKRREQLCLLIEGLAKALGSLPVSEYRQLDPQAKLDQFVALTLQNLREFLVVHNELGLQSITEKLSGKLWDQICHGSEELIREEVAYVLKGCQVTAASLGAASNAKAAESAKSLFILAVIVRLFGKMVVPIVAGDIALRNNYSSVAKGLFFDVVTRFGGYSSEIVTVSWENSRWEAKKEPSEVSGYATMLVEEWEGFEKLASSLAPLEAKHSRGASSAGSVLSQGSASQSALGTRQGTGTSSAVRSPQSGQGGSVAPIVAQFTRRETRLSLASNVDRMLNKGSGAVHHFKPSTLDAPHLMESIVLYTLRTMQDLVRERLFNKNGFQQLQVDCSYLLQAITRAEQEGHPLVHHEERSTDMINELLCSCYERCSERSALPPAAVEQLAKTRLQAEEANRKPASPKAPSAHKDPLVK